MQSREILQLAEQRQLYLAPRTFGMEISENFFRTLAASEIPDQIRQSSPIVTL
jgi:hypothetical protein